MGGLSKVSQRWAPSKIKHRLPHIFAKTTGAVISAPSGLISAGCVESRQRKNVDHQWTLLFGMLRHMLVHSRVAFALQSAG